MLFSEGGPPDPISYLRRVAGDTDDSSADIKRTDSADDVSTHEENNGNLTHPNHRQQDPPARERPAVGQAWPYRESLSFTRSLIFYGAGAVTSEHERACKAIQESRRLRLKYFEGAGTVKNTDALKNLNVKFQFGKDGVVELFDDKDHEKLDNLAQVPNIKEFKDDYMRLVEMVKDGAMRSFCFQRLQLLSSAFRTHITMNGPVEAQEQSNLLGTDFYRTLKIDNHIHAAAAPR
jgi:hypothetical protein